MSENTPKPPESSLESAPKPPHNVSKNSAPIQKSPLKGLVMLGVKILVAVGCIWFVCRSLTWRDTATIPENFVFRNVIFSQDTEVTILGHEDLGNGGELYHVEFPASVDVTADMGNGRVIHVLDDGTREILNIGRVEDLPAQDFKGIDNTNAVVHEGLKSILVKASGKWYLLVAACLLLVIPFLVSAVRWRGLLHPLGIYLPVGTCLQLTFVGQFFSIILPGITGGDLVKIIYAAKLTGSKSKSLITVLLDRVIGLIALMVIAATSSGLQLLWNSHEGQAVDGTLLRVFVLIVGLLACLGLSAFCYFSRRMRKLVGIDWFMTTFKSTANPDTQHHQHDKLEMLYRVVNVIVLLGGVVIAAGCAILRWHSGAEWAVGHALLLFVGVIFGGVVMMAAGVALVFHTRIVDRLMPVLVKGVGTVIGLDEVLHTYRGHFGLMFWAFLISIPSQLTLPVSAWLSGLALGINLNVGYYLAYVPVAVLAASLPVALPQGIGVLDGIIVHFFANRATATASQAFALAQSIRFLPIVWNLVGGYWVMTGSYSRARMHEEERAIEAKEAGGEIENGE